MKIKLVLTASLILNTALLVAVVHLNLSLVETQADRDATFEHQRGWKAERGERMRLENTNNESVK